MEHSDEARVVPRRELGRKPDEDALVVEEHVVWRGALSRAGKDLEGRFCGNLQQGHIGAQDPSEEESGSPGSTKMDMTM